MKRLPIGRSSLPEIIGCNGIYVDKTEYFMKMITSEKYYFLSRPRRFGKSLTISALKEIFKGNRDLFKETFIHTTDYDWQVYPVIHLDFSLFDAEDSVENLYSLMQKQIQTHSENYGITLNESSVKLQFDELILKLSEQNRVVILIDEYDNPIISNLGNGDKVLRIKEILKGFYKVIKARDEQVKFAFLTGVTKFSQVSVFSGLNNLSDISMDDRYGAVCGYTEREIKEFFSDYILKLTKDSGKTEDMIFSELKSWYNGFRFTEEDIRVYNPWSTLNFLNTGKLKNYWFNTGTPGFLVDLISGDNSFYISGLKDMVVESSEFSTFETESLKVLPLLFQTGYLTIKTCDPEYDEYTLDFPNKEVKDSFLKNLLQVETGYNPSLLVSLRKSLTENNLDEFFEIMDTLFSKIDYDLHLKEEKYWQSLFYMVLTLLGYKIHAEFKTNRGRIDAVLETNSRIYIFEFKMGFNEDVALNQIKEREYFKRFRDSDKEIVLAGSSFVIEEKRLINRYVTEVVKKG